MKPQLIAFATAFALLATPSLAVDARIASACAGDYLSLCSQHNPDSPGVRRCFKTNGSSLSSQCVNALVAAGEISKADVERKSARR
ncbi:MAG: hypothetical protein K2Y05_00900 [Hyphomicrobiaceae bacterium]|nr:hypothetical protein [Hyphomicrobiaceae bacterium]